jgi:hypothetical protein
MRGKVEVDPDGRFIRAQFEEDATIADWNEAFQLHAALVQKSGIRDTLVDVRKQKASAPTLDLFGFGSRLPKDVRFAVLARPHDDDRFVESVARNRGATARLFFGSEEEAVSWLLGR